MHPRGTRLSKSQWCSTFILPPKMLGFVDKSLNKIAQNRTKIPQEIGLRSVRKIKKAREQQMVGIVIWWELLSFTNWVLLARWLPWLRLTFSAFFSHIWPSLLVPTFFFVPYSIVFLQFTFFTASYGEQSRFLLYYTSRDPSGIIGVL